MRLLALLLSPIVAFAAPTESRENLEWKKGEKLDTKDLQPLVNFLHGAGERGSNLDQLKKHGPPKIAMNGHGLPFILAAPQCPADRWWNPDQVIALAQHLAKALRVDPKRIHLTGISMGGYGTWACLAKEPTLYASGVPICGGGDPAAAGAIKDIPIWAFHGEKDQAVPETKTREMEDAILKVGGKKFRSTYFPEEGHESWNPAYADPALLGWMMLQQLP